MNGAAEIASALGGSRHQEAADRLRDAMRAAGVDPVSELIADGQLHRFDSPTGKRGRHSGWYVLFDSGIAVLDSWKGDIEHRVITPNGNGNGKLGRADREKIKHAKREAEAERKKLQAEAAIFARRLWASAEPVRAQSEHSYLVAKRIQPRGIRRRGQTLYVPMYDVASGKIINLQFIRADGSKVFLKTAQAAGCYFPINDLGADHASRLNEAEGFATAASIHEGTHAPTAAAFNAGNLLAVADALHRKHPGAQLVICADDDRETPDNPGLTKAIAAARAVNGLLAVPKFDDPAGKTDFNDLAIEQGLDAVRKQISSAAPVKPDDSGFPAGFRLTKATLFVMRERGSKEEPRTEEYPVCSRLLVTALTRSDDRGNWGRLLQFDDPDGHQHEWPMPAEMLGNLCTG
jgi:putative DNA primase/helicase